MVYSNIFRYHYGKGMGLMDWEKIDRIVTDNRTIVVMSILAIIGFIWDCFNHL